MAKVCSFLCKRGGLRTDSALLGTAILHHGRVNGAQQKFKKNHKDPRVNYEADLAFRWALSGFCTDSVLLATAIFVVILPPWTSERSRRKERLTKVNAELSWFVKNSVNTLNFILCRFMITCYCKRSRLRTYGLRFTRKLVFFIGVLLPRLSD